MWCALFCVVSFCAGGAISLVLFVGRDGHLIDADDAEREQLNGK